MSTLPSQATSRWRVMQALADADVPLDRNELAQRSGVNRAVVQSTLYSPLRARWVVFAVVPGSRAARKYVFAITARGSRALADHLKEFSS